MAFFGLFKSKAAAQAAAPEALTRGSCAGCQTSCFDRAFEALDQRIQDKLNEVRGSLIEARRLHVTGDLSGAAREAKKIASLLKEVSTLGDFRSAVDGMFAKHVPEAPIQVFIATSMRS